MRTWIIITMSQAMDRILEEATPGIAFSRLVAYHWLLWGSQTEIGNLSHLAMCTSSYPTGFEGRVMLCEMRCRDHRSRKCTCSRIPREQQIVIDLLYASLTFPRIQSAPADVRVH